MEADRCFSFGQKNNCADTFSPSTQTSNYQKITRMASRIRPSFQVFNLYRRALKELSNNLDRDTLSLEAAKVRKEFEEYKGEVNPDKVRFLIERAHYWIDQVRHSEPYVGTYQSSMLFFMRVSSVFFCCCCFCNKLFSFLFVS